MPPPVTAAEVNATYFQLRRRLIESGEWDQLRTLLEARLNESGWMDEIKDICKEKAKEGNGALSVQQLFKETRKLAQDKVPRPVKQEMNNVIRQQIDKHFS